MYKWKYKILYIQSIDILECLLAPSVDLFNDLDRHTPLILQEKERRRKKPSITSRSFIHSFFCVYCLLV